MDSMTDPQPDPQPDVDRMVADLRAALDADERLANQITYPGWTAVDGERGPKVNPGPAPTEEWSREVHSSVWLCDDVEDGCPDLARAWMAEAEHIARHDPASVLRLVAAHREILELHARPHDCSTLVAGGNRSPVDGEQWTYHEDRHYEDAPCPTLRSLAAAYADRDESGGPA